MKHKSIDFEKRSAELLASAKRILLSKPEPLILNFEWKETMNTTTRKPKHARHAELTHNESPIENSSETQSTIQPSEDTQMSKDNAVTEERVTLTAEEVTFAKEKTTRAEITAAALARREAEALAAAERKASKEAAKIAKADAVTEKKLAFAALKAEREAAKLEREAATSEAGGYAGSMLSLRDAKTRYVRGLTGQLHSGDELAETLSAVEPGNVIALALGVLELPANPYAHLNVGQQSMNLRNKMRLAVGKGTLTIDTIKQTIADNELAIPDEVLAARAERRATAIARREAVVQANA
jgi:hypothetical protein